MKTTWSQQYYNTLTPAQHAANNNWFEQMLSYLKEDGILYVPVLDKSFNKQGHEIFTVIQGGKNNV